MAIAFEFDPQKSASTKAKHGIDFVEAQALWQDPAGIRAPADSSSEPRFALIAKLGEHHWFAVYTRRGEHVRLITVRRARANEVAVYEQQRATTTG